MTHPAPTAEETLTQLGYYSKDTAFLSLTLKPAELDVLQRAMFRAPLPADSRIETTLTTILSQWLGDRASNTKGIADGNAANRTPGASDTSTAVVGMPVLRSAG